MTSGNHRSQLVGAKAASRMIRRSVPQLRTIDETAEILNTSSRTVRRLIDSGALPVQRLGLNSQPPTPASGSQGYTLSSCDSGR